MFDRTDPGSNPPQVTIRLPDGQTLRGAARERRQEADRSWWMKVTVTLLVQNLTAGGQLTSEPEPVSFWAPLADGVCSPIEGQDYSAVPTTRHPGLLRQQARARAVGQRGRARQEWA
ncbi:hypothetical protein ACEZDB_35645 [Streptacidiphilus sp. N1-3]|uniref:Uncharacterized protein n=1 Tax=Streptacidiphilus alkalitolerans TaxID=3342712 RepID=A0ABV6XCG7_9ACTN